MEYFTVHVNSDEAFRAAYRGYVKGDSKFPAVEFVVSIFVNTGVYLAYQDKITRNNLKHGRKDRIRNPRPIWEDMWPAVVEIHSVEDLDKQLALRGNFWRARIPNSVTKEMRESIAHTASLRGIEVRFQA